MRVQIVRFGTVAEPIPQVEAPAGTVLRRYGR